MSRNITLHNITANKLMIFQLAYCTYGNRKSVRENGSAGCLCNSLRMPRLSVIDSDVSRQRSNHIPSYFSHYRIREYDVSEIPVIFHRCTGPA